MKADIHNLGKRTYHLPDGQELGPGKTVSVDEKIATQFKASYPKEIVSPDTLRSGPDAQSNRDKSREIARLRDENKALREQLASGSASVDPNVQRKFEDLNQQLADANASVVQMTQTISDQGKKIEEFVSQNMALTNQLAALKNTQQPQAETPSQGA